jgi:hypothetical protein
MGFEFRRAGEGRCVFRVKEDGDDTQEFLFCVQQALRSLSLNILIDVSQRPQALVVVLPHLLKLQKVLEGQGKSISVFGLRGRIPEEFLNKFTSLGIQLAENLASHPPVGSEELMHSVGGVTGVVSPGTEPQPLPTAAEIDRRFTDLRKRLAESLQRKRFLETEKKTYIERLKTISKGRGGSDVTTEQVEKVAALEAELLRLKDEKAMIQKKADESGTARYQADEESKKMIGDAQAEHKKKREPLEKKLADILKQREKIQSDFKKKFENRRNQLAQLNKKAKAPPPGS